MDENFLSDINKKLQLLKKWTEVQTHLPQKIENNVLKIFLLSKEGDLQATKDLLEYHFKFRSEHPSIFANRDPLEQITQQTLDVLHIIQLPGRTPDNCKVFLFKLNDTNPAKYDCTEAVRLFFLFNDLIAVHEDHNHAGEVIIVDADGLSWRHLLKISLNALRVFMKGIQEFFPLRMKQMHILNANVHMENALGCMKPLINSELFDLIQIHMPDSEKPYETFPRDLMPNEYGGKAGSQTELQAQWIAKLMEYREYLMTDSNFITI